MHKAIVIASSLIISMMPTISIANQPFSGAYIGIDGGPAWASSNYQTNPNCPPTSFAVFCESQALSNANGGAVANSGTGHINLTRSNFDVHAGYNWLMRNFVVGGEAELGSLNLNKTVTTTGIFPVPFLGNAYTLNNSISASWLGALRLRAGAIIREHFLIYAAGGFAFTNFKYTSSYNDNAIGFGFPGGNGTGSSSGRNQGWTLGAGGEWQFNDHYSIQIEYLYIKFKYLNADVPLSNTPAFQQTMQTKANLRTEIARIGLNYKF